MKGNMVRRIAISILLAVQALVGGAVTLAHARDVLDAPPGVEASHDGRCAILHDELRCALCHYASARVVHRQTIAIPAPVDEPRLTPPQPVVAVTQVVRLTAPARAPPFLS